MNWQNMIAVVYVLGLALAFFAGQWWMKRSLVRKRERLTAQNFHAWVNRLEAGGIGVVRETPEIGIP